MTTKRMKILGILPVTLMMVTLLSGSLGVNLALADHGDGGSGGGDHGGRGNSASAAVQSVPVVQSNQTQIQASGDDSRRGPGAGNVISVVNSTGTVATSTMMKHNDDQDENENENVPANAALTARVTALEVLVQQLEAALLQIEQKLGIVDVVAPVISQTTAMNITTSTADIAWNTNELATSKVYVSTSTPVNLATAQIVTSTTLVASHSLHLSGLTASTTYFFVVESADASNNISQSAGFSFVTGSPDVVAPIISSVTAANVATSTADITWATNEPATSKVYMSTSTPVNLVTATSVLGSTLVLNHSLHLSGLTASTTYFFVVESKDAANNTATSTEHNFVTTP